MTHENGKTFDETFDLGAFDDYEAKEPEGSPFLPPSVGEKRKGSDGKEHSVYVGKSKAGKPLGPIYGLVLDKPLTRRQNFFGEQVGSLQFRSVKQDNVVVFDDIPEFPKPEHLQASILANIEEARAEAEEAGTPFEEPSDADIEKRIERRKRGLQAAKFRAISLREAIAPSSIGDLQGEDASGLLVGAVLSFNKKSGRNQVVRYFPAGMISDGSGEKA